MTGTYVYCLVAARRRPAAGRIRSALPGAGPVRVIEQGAAAGGLKTWLVVSDVPLDRYGAKAINERLSDLDWVSRAAIAHEAVVESFISAPALLPMKLFTIFTGDERASRHISAQTRRVDAALARVRHHVELGVRVVLDRSKTSRAVRPGRVATGVAYLAVKKAQRDATAELATHARETVAALYDDLAQLATEAVKRPPGGAAARNAPLLLDAAFLVRKARAARFRTAVAREARALQPAGYVITLTGPWPPYSFVAD